MTSFLRAIAARRPGASLGGKRVRRASGLAVILFVGALAADGRLPDWVRFVEGDSPLRDAFFRTVSLPSGPVRARRPARETRPALTELIRQRPSEADLYALRAREAERALDFDAAEADWKRHAELSSDTAQGQLALADFYHRRLRPREEVEALLAVGQSPTPAAERLLPPERQRSWQAFERSLQVIQAHGLPADLAGQQHRAWQQRYPERADVSRRHFEHLRQQERLADAQALLANYEESFPDDRVFPVQARAEIARQRGSADEALAVYDQAFEPLWPGELINGYFSLLQQARRLRQHLDRARAAVAADPGDLKAAAWIFYYYQRQGNLGTAQQALHDFRLRQESGGTWTADRLFTLAKLFASINNHDEAARCYYALYSLPEATDADAERALTGLVELLLSAPERPIHFGSGDLSFYRDIATIDDHPGFLNGILSLLLNSASPRYRFAQQEQTAVAYFHRAKAEELLELADTRFSDSPAREKLHAELIDAYAVYGDNEGIVRAARRFLATFKDSPRRTHVSMRVAEAYARLERVEEEFATYNALLEELARQAEGVPIGAAPAPPVQVARINPRVFHPGRSPEYVRVLDRYLARLVSLKRERDALALYAREIERNPDDPGLYERLAAFLQQNGLGAQIEQVYRRAINRFQEPSWYHKLARWYLRQRQRAEFERLTREVTGLFSGTDLDEYFQQVVVRGNTVDPLLYLQLNLYAHRRFPHNLAFVHNLLLAYQTRETRNRAEWERLLREHWFQDEILRARFFAYLSRQGRLEGEMRAVEASLASARAGRWDRLVAENPAAAELMAEVDLWRCHFETAAPVVRALAEEFGADEALARRAASAHRSLAQANTDLAITAVSIEENLSRLRPGDREQLARLGDIWAEGERYENAAPYWDRMAEVQPGDSEGYLEAATVFWDYFRFDDALRLLQEGRGRLNQPALYSYEAGAVYENRREYPQAIAEYLKGALDSGSGSRARSRLLRLAARTRHRQLINEATAGLVAEANPAPEAVDLRVAVLEAQQRPDDLEQFLLRLAANTNSLELLDRIQRIGTNQHLDSVRTRSLERQIELVQDPVDRARLQLSLMRLHEGREDLTAAEQLVEGLYRERPRILGVVRALADYHWRHDNHDRTLAVLAQAAEVSHPQLRKQFTFEIARKATEAERYELARRSLTTLLAEEPFQPPYLAAMADTYGREKRYDALRDFYRAKLDELRQSELPAERKKQQTAALRRGLIPALTELGDHAAALDQFIEIINRFPEDEALVEEAASYADRHGLRPRILDYYVRTTTESPKDVRYHVVLAELHQRFEDYAAAIAAYRRASEVRPDRTDLLTARAALQERLLQFGDALATYHKLYELTYENPQWMEKIAEVHARQGNRQEAVAAIERAFVSGRPERPENYFAAAERLEGWNLVAEAASYAAKGVELAGDHLFSHTPYHSGARLYVRLMTRERKHEEAYSHLQRAWRADPRDPWRYPFVAALRELGAAVDHYFTPEEKSAVVTFLESEKSRLGAADVDETLIPLVETAGLVGLEVKWRYERMMAQPGQGSASAHQQRLVELQRQRLQHNELGAQLEAYWQVYPPKSGRDAVLQQAAEAYYEAGNEDAEFRVHSTLARHHEPSERYFELLLARRPAELVTLSSPRNEKHHPDRPANYAVAAGDVDLALRAVRARGANRPPVWTRAYTGLVGLHFLHDAPEIQQSFLEALGSGAIEERVGQPVDRDQQLAGDLWFYFGSRYGEYLGTLGRAEVEDYLPAMVEGAPGRFSAYSTLADYYRQSRQPDRALADYENALELNPALADVHHRMAQIHWKQGRRDEATGHWRSALQVLTDQISKGTQPPTLWKDVPEIFDSVGQRGQLTDLQEEAAGLLRMYVRRNGAYRVEPLLQAFVTASANSAAAVDHILDLAGVAANAVEYLSVLANASWLPRESRERAFERVLQAAERQMSEAQARAQYYARQALNQWRLRWIEYLLETRQGNRTQAVIGSFSETDRLTLGQSLPPLELRAAVQIGQLDALLSEYRREPQKTPQLRHFREAAVTLNLAGDTGAARQLLDFFYTRSIESRDLQPSYFLGLGELRFEQGRPEEALALLRRLVLVEASPFASYVPAAELLTKAGRDEDALRFLQHRVEAVPWDTEAQVLLAERELAADSDRSAARDRLNRVVSARYVAYEKRVAAARALGQNGAAAVDLGAAELDLLATTVDPSSPGLQHPFVFDARTIAAERATDNDTRVRLLEEALAIGPGENRWRAALFRAARESGRHHLAIAAMMPLLERAGLGYALQQSDSLLQEDPGSVSSRHFQTQSFLTGEGFDESERARIAGELADSFTKLQRLDAAALAYGFGLQFRPPPEQREVLETALETIEAQRRHRAENARRRPVVTRNLEQDRLVRPKLEILNQGGGQ